MQKKRQRELLCSLISWICIKSRIYYSHLMQMEERSRKIFMVRCKQREISTLEQVPNEQQVECGNGKPFSNNQTAKRISLSDSAYKRLSRCLSRHRETLEQFLLQTALFYSHLFCSVQLCCCLCNIWARRRILFIYSHTCQWIFSPCWHWLVSWC